jgi:hypothetical protein
MHDIDRRTACKAVLGSMLGLAFTAATATAQPRPWWEERRRREEYERWREAEMRRREREARRRRQAWRRDSWQEERERQFWAQRQPWFRRY